MQTHKSELEKELVKFGLEKKRAEVYLALLQVGCVPVKDVAKAAGVKRTTAYSILKTLEKDGFAALAMDGKKQVFVPEDPAMMLSQLKSKQTVLERLMPELRSIYNLLPSKPRVKFYEGLEGIKAIFEDTLVTRPKEIVGFTSIDDLFNIFGDFAVDYAHRKGEANIPARAIALDTPMARGYAKKYYVGVKPEAAPKIRFLPPNKFPLKNRIYVYSNKFAFMSLEPAELMGVIIESAAVADTQRLIFELAWEAAERYSHK